jgi:hypothetical protein
MASQTRLDRATWRPMHNRILLALGVGWALDSFEVQIIGSVLTPLARDFGVLGADGAISPGAVSVIWVWPAPRRGRTRTSPILIRAQCRRPAWRRNPHARRVGEGLLGPQKSRSGSATSR